MKIGNITLTTFKKSKLLSELRVADYNRQLSACQRSIFRRYAEQLQHLSVEDKHIFCAFVGAKNITDLNKEVAVFKYELNKV